MSVLRGIQTRAALTPAMSPSLTLTSTEPHFQSPTCPLSPKNLNLLFLEIKGRSRVAQACNVGVKCFGNSNRFFLMSLGPCCALQNTSQLLDNGLKLQKLLKFGNLVLNLNIYNLNYFIFCIYSPSNFSSKFCDEALRQITKIINQLVRLGMKMMIGKGNVEENK